MVIFLTSSKEEKEKNSSKIVMKTVASIFHPVKGDMIDDPGFESRVHNGYDVVK